MAADQIIDITVNQNATFSAVMTWISGGLPMNVTGYSAKMQVRDRLSFKNTKIIELTDLNGGIVLGDVNGKITISLTSTQTSSLTPGIYYYDLILGITGTEHRVSEGSFIVSAGTTTLV